VSYPPLSPFDKWNLTLGNHSAPMSFFSTTDTGVTVNRFSQDLQLIDMELPIAALNTFASMASTLSQADLINPILIASNLSFHHGHRASGSNKRGLCLRCDRRPSLHHCSLLHPKILSTHLPPNSFLRPRGQVPALLQVCGVCKRTRHDPRIRMAARTTAEEPRASRLVTTTVLSPLRRPALAYTRAGPGRCRYRNAADCPRRQVTGNDERWVCWRCAAECHLVQSDHQVVGDLLDDVGDAYRGGCQDQDIWGRNSARGPAGGEGDSSAFVAVEGCHRLQISIGGL